MRNHCGVTVTAYERLNGVTEVAFLALIDPAEFIHEPLRAEVAQAQGKLRDIAFDTLE